MAALVQVTFFWLPKGGYVAKKADLNGLLSYAHAHTHTNSVYTHTQGIQMLIIRVYIRALHCEARLCTPKSFALRKL